MASTTKKDLSEALFEEMGINKVEAKQIVDVFFEEISRALERDDEVLLSNFGLFEIRDKTARPGRNPRTNKPVTIKPRRAIIFHASQKMKELVETELREKAWSDKK